MWDLPRPGMEPVSPALAGRFLTTEPPGKSSICEKNSHKGIIIGKGGAMIKKIGTNSRYEIEKLLDAKVNLKLFVKVKKDWRDSDFELKNFGYKKEDLS